jgi:hypothetical protein
VSQTLNCFFLELKLFWAALAQTVTDVEWRCEASLYRDVIKKILPGHRVNFAEQNLYRGANYGNLIT